MSKFILTLASKQDWQVPQLSHVESLEDLTLVASSITVQTHSSVLVAIVLVSESQTGTDWNLSTDNSIASIEAFGEHVHRSSLAISDTLPSTKQLTDDGLHGTTTHQGKPVASVGGDNIILLGERVLNSDSNGFLSG